MTCNYDCFHNSVIINLRILKRAINLSIFFISLVKIHCLQELLQHSNIINVFKMGICRFNISQFKNNFKTPEDECGDASNSSTM